jgi:hypothetical protein
MLALDNGDKIRGDAAAATVVDFTLHGFVGSTATQLADGQLASSIGDLYTAGAAGIGVSSIVLVNTDSVARAVNLYLTPSGGTARRLIPKDLSLGIGFSLITDGKTVTVINASGEVLTTGDTGPAPAGQLFLSAAGGWPQESSGSSNNAKKEYATNDINLFRLLFDATSQEYAQWTVGMPSDWDAGTITATFFWTAASGSGGVVWGLQGISYGDSDAIDQAWGTAQEVTDTLLTANDVHISPTSGAITISGAGASELVQFRAYRDPTDGSDTLAVDAELIGVMVAFTRS